MAVTPLPVLSRPYAPTSMVELPGNKISDARAAEATFLVSIAPPPVSRSTGASFGVTSWMGGIGSGIAAAVGKVAKGILFGTPVRCKTVQELVSFYGSCWDARKKCFTKAPSFEREAFYKLCAENVENFPLAFDVSNDYGWCAKKVVPSSTQVFVRADLHGDLKSLLENLAALQDQGLLDESYKCKEGVELVFLGDYMDRGPHSMQVLTLLLTLRLENPFQVNLIRGNHESVALNERFTPLGTSDSCDVVFESILADDPEILDTVYNTFPLCLFLGERGSSGKVQYVMFTHGLFELYFDPSEMLSSDSDFDCMSIARKPYDSVIGVYGSLSSRVRSIAFKMDKDYKSALATSTNKADRQRLKLEWAARRIAMLSQNDRRQPFELSITSFNWGDMHNPDSSGNYLPTEFTSLGARKWRMGPEDVYLFMRLMGGKGSSVKLIFRGHQHVLQHHTYKVPSPKIDSTKIIVTTLPVAMDTSGYEEDHPKKRDISYVLTTQPLVKDWIKRVLDRAPLSSDTSSKSFSIYDIEG